MSHRGIFNKTHLSLLSKNPSFLSRAWRGASDARWHRFRPRSMDMTEGQARPNAVCVVHQHHQCGVRAVYMRCVWLNLSKLLLPQLQMLKPRPLLCAPRRHDWPDFCDNYPYVPLGVNIVQWLECEVDAVEARGQQVACRVSTRQISRCTPGCTQAAHA